MCREGAHFRALLGLAWARMKDLHPAQVGRQHTAGLPWPPWPHRGWPSLCLTGVLCRLCTPGDRTKGLICVAAGQRGPGLDALVRCQLGADHTPDETPPPPRPHHPLGFTCSLSQPQGTSQVGRTQGRGWSLQTLCLEHTLGRNHALVVHTKRILEMCFQLAKRTILDDCGITQSPWGQSAHL